MLGVLGVLNVLNVLNLLNVLNVLNVLNMPHGRIVGLLGLVKSRAVFRATIMLVPTTPALLRPPPISLCSFTLPSLSLAPYDLSRSARASFCGMKIDQTK